MKDNIKNRFYNETNKKYPDENKKEEKNENYILAEINIKEDYINKDIRIINTFEEYKRRNYLDDEKDDYKYENEKEIKENCEIKINNNIIPFSYYYKFKNKGKYKIEYTFKNKLSKTCYMFFNCSSLTNINLSILILKM